MTTIPYLGHANELLVGIDFWNVQHIMFNVAENAFKHIIGNSYIAINFLFY